MRAEVSTYFYKIFLKMPFKPLSDADKAFGNGFYSVAKRQASVR
nr:MAG TPA: hypothetical protein [Caudoviricetes sp.]